MTSLVAWMGIDTHEASPTSFGSFLHQENPTTLIFGPSKIPWETRCSPLNFPFHPPMDAAQQSLIG